VKFGRFSAMAGSGVLVAGALIGITGVGTASAATQPTTLCVDSSSQGDECIYASGYAEWGVTMIPEGGVSGDYTDWSYPSTNGIGAINLGGEECLQVDQAAGYVVRYTNCSGDAAEEWENVYDSGAHRTLFVSVWGLDNGLDLCLSADYSNGNVMADNCVSGWYQEWGTS
jgi:hypothetical protein